MKQAVMDTSRAGLPEEKPSDSWDKQTPRGLLRRNVLGRR